MLEILRALQRDELQRSEVVSWHRAVKNQFPEITLSVADGYWYFASFAFLDVPIIGYDGPGMFIRDVDIDEYRLDIQRVPAQTGHGAVRRLRSHQIDASAPRWPLSTFRYSSHTDLNGLQAVRGTFEERGDMVEHLHLAFGDAVYLILRQFDEYVEQAMILGTDRDPDKLARFMAELEIEPFFFQ